ncbi:amidohydrolase family protein [Niabella terrae]
MKIDAHQHFWNYDPLRDQWIDDSMQRIRRDYLPGHLQPLLAQNGIDGCVVVQSDQAETETLFQLIHALRHDFIKGVVGWVDLQASDIEEKLAHYRYYKKLKGFRHVLQGEKDRALMLRKRFKRGISLLHRYQFTYDLLIFPDQLGFARQLAAAYPDQPFVIDHIAKPPIRTGGIADWKRDIRAIAALPNVCCKISGMVTESDWQQWKYADFVPYLDVVVEAFGTRRILYGSDWPVCLLAASYKKMYGIVARYFSGFSSREQADFFGGNAVRFYQLR